VILQETPLTGAWVIQVESVEDDRGLFARTFDTDLWEEWGLEPVVVQCSTSYNRRAGTVRGMHYQAEPFEETKLVRCTRGAIYDVIVDVRRDSPTFRGWFSVELTADNRTMLYIPAGVAHGFQTLVDDAEVYYQISERYSPEHARGVRWDDPALGIDWPDAAERTISERDRSYPDLRA
jgi:dTDP-4-dehydrorhamnose 3,5-epimerase